MVLELAGGLFGQQDVRETPTDAMVQGNFDTNDFSVAAGVVSLKNKTSYWSCSGDNFIAINPDVDNIEISNGKFKSSEDNVYTRAPVFMPNGAIITGCIIYGNVGATNETWELNRIAFSNASTSVMATANIETEDTTISNATIDNSSYGYFIQTGAIDTNDEIWGARITYTTDYI